MNKKVVLGIVAVLVVAVVLVGGYFLFGNKKDEKTNNQDNKTQTEGNNSSSSTSGTSSLKGKVLVVYYSATGSTKKVADEIAKNLNADLFEIEPESVYTADDLDWTDNNSRVSKEHDDESLRDVKLKSTKVDDWDTYDTVLIGYPIWWGVAAWPVNTFVKNNDFDGKTVIPFCTSASSGLGQSDKLLEDLANKGNWLDGHRFSSGSSNSDIKSWTDSL